MLPANVAQDIIRRVVREWTVYKKLLKMKAEGTYTEKVGIPRYTKKNSVYNTIYMRATLSDKSLKENIVDIPKTDISVKTLHADTLRQVNVSYRTGIWFIDVVYEDRTEIPEKTTSATALGIDCGIDNFATIVANDAAFRPVIFDGRELKSINRYYNKLISQYKSQKSLDEPDFTGSDENTDKMWAERFNRITDIMHLYSRRAVDLAMAENASVIVIGHTDRWKDSMNIGKKNNQNFAYIPYNTFIEQVKYKAAEVGIEVILQEESYTSKSSFFDDDAIPVYGEENETRAKHTFSGKRVKRGLYKTKDGIVINADVNGALNILRKHLNVSSKEIIPLECIGVVMAPRRVRISELRPRRKACKIFNAIARI